MFEGWKNTYFIVVSWILDVWYVFLFSTIFREIISIFWKLYFYWNRFFSHAIHSDHSFPNLHSFILRFPISLFPRSTPFLFPCRKKSSTRKVHCRHRKTNLHTNTSINVAIYFIKINQYEKVLFLLFIIIFY